MRFVVVLLLREAVLVEVERVTRDESVMTLCVRVNVLLIAAGPWRAREECVPVGSNALFWKNPRRLTVAASAQGGARIARRAMWTARWMAQVMNMSNW